MECKCGHSKPEHIKMYKEDLKRYEIHGEPYNCLVSTCNCKKYTQNVHNAKNGGNNEETKA